MSRVAEQRAERLEALRYSSMREGTYAADYEMLADILEKHATGEKAEEEIARLRKTAEHHRGWAQKWLRDLEGLEAQYSRTEPSAVGQKPTAGDIKRYLQQTEVEQHQAVQG